MNEIIKQPTLPSMFDPLEGLNPEQREVALHDNGPLLVLATAGSGKSLSVIRRTAYLIKVKKVQAERILMLTFTRKAADEMQTRLDALIGKSRTKICTAHVLAWAIMREEYGITDKNYDKGQVRFITKKYCEKNRIDPNVLSRFMGLAKNELAGPANPRAIGIAIEICQNAHPKITDPLMPAALVTAYAEVEKQRIEMQIYTHDDALFYAVAEFYRNDLVRQKWAGRYDYVTQDEVQDQSMAQLKLIEMIAKDHGNYVAIGDTAQCVQEGTLVSVFDSIGSSGIGCKIETLKIGDRVLSKGNTAEKEIGVVNHVTCIGERECVTICTTFGYSLTASTDHRVWARPPSRVGLDRWHVFTRQAKSVIDIDEREFWEVSLATLLPGDEIVTRAGYETILSRAEAGPKVCWDIGVDKYENYFSNGILSHNCIYKFRGAHPERTTSFTTDWPGARVIRMHRNYRSATPIIAAANLALGRMPADQRLSGAISGERAIDGHVEIDAYDTIDDQARGIATRVLAAHAAGKPWSDFVVLYRVRSLERAVEEAFIKEKIPHVVIGGTSFYDRTEIRALLAYCRLAIGIFDADDVKNCINSPTRYMKKEFGSAVMDRVKDCDYAEDRWLQATEETCKEFKIWKKAQTAAIEWALTIDDLAEEEERAVAAAEWTATPESPERPEAPSVVRMLTDLVEQIGYEEYLRKTNGAPSIENDAINVEKEWIGSCQRFRTLRELVSHADSMREMHKKQQKDETGKAMLMTCHSAKALEFDTVFVAGCIDGIMPHKLAESPDEEARLFYVATTRAKNHLIYCTFAEYNGHQTNPSRYLSGIRLTAPYNRIRRSEAGDRMADAFIGEIMPPASLPETVETECWVDSLFRDED
jgi:superfamily I DNA/RNA helicase